MEVSEQIQLIVFDMDGVLAHLDYAKRLRTLASLTGKDPAFIQTAVYESDFESSAEAGAYLTGAEYLAEYNRRIDGALTREQWVGARRDAMTPILETFSIARRLKESVPLAALTNNGSLLKEAIGDILPAAAEVFGASFHASYEFGARKPDLKVFARLASRYRVAVERILFIDDQPAYLAGAMTAGLKTILFTTPEGLLQQLRAHPNLTVPPSLR